MKRVFFFCHRAHGQIGPWCRQTWWEKSVESMMIEQPFGMKWQLQCDDVTRRVHNGKHECRQNIRGKVCVTCISWNTRHISAHCSYVTGVCTLVEEWGPCVQRRKALSWSCAACPVRWVCKRGHNTRVGWLGLLGAGQASMAAKRPSLRWQPEVHCVPEWKDRILTELKQKGLCGSGDARLAVASALWNCLHSKSHFI